MKIKGNRGRWIFRDGMVRGVGGNTECVLQGEDQEETSWEIIKRKGRAATCKERTREETRLLREREAGGRALHQTCSLTVGEACTICTLYTFCTLRFVLHSHYLHCVHCTVCTIFTPGNVQSQKNIKFNISKKNPPGKSKCCQKLKHWHPG